MKAEIIKSEVINGCSINVYGSTDNPLFLAKDVARWIEHTNSREMLRSVDPDEKGRMIVDTLGGPQEQNVLTEDGLYEVFMQSRKPIARQFKKVVKQMLKEMRTFGFTATQEKLNELANNPDLLIKLGEAIKKERSKREVAELQVQLAQDTIKENAPKVAFSDSVAASKNSILIGDMAKILKQNGIPTGQNRLFQWLRDNRYLCRSGARYNLPTQRSMELELFEIQETTINKPEGETFIQKTSKITGKGQQYFVKKFLSSVEQTA